MSELSPEEWHKLLGRVTALEFMAAQSWAMILQPLEKEAREAVAVELQLRLEERLKLLHTSIVEQSALDCVERVFSSAVETCKSIDETKEPPDSSGP